MNSRRLLAVSVFALPLLLVLAAPAAAESNCNDNIDNDGDTFVDHLDTSCYENNCIDGLDNDGDGHFDELTAGTPSGNEGPDPDCQCLDDVIDFTGGCTANDVSFVLIGLGTQTDGCVNPNDTVTILMGAQLTTTANTRYDIGMWVATDPVNQVGNDARVGRSCKREILTLVSETATNAQICSGNGPFIDLDDPNGNTADKCGEIRTDNGTPDDCGAAGLNRINAVHTFSAPVTIPCSRAANGLVNLETCSTWDNQSSDGGNNKPHCTNFTQAFPGTNSKCRCEEQTVSSIPQPNLNLSCGCVSGGGVATCTVTYTNAGQGTCNQAAGTAENEFDCGVARYIEFRTAFPTVNGTVTSNSSARGTRSVNDGTGIITWRPGNDPTNTTGWIGVNETDTLTFQFTNDGTPATSLDFSTTAFWSNSNTFSNAVAQSTLTCSVQAATPVSLAQVRTEVQGSDVVLRWTTATETGNAGFNVYAETADGAKQLNGRLIKSEAVDSLAPHQYRFRVPALGLEGAKFFIEDVALDGRKRRQGPFTVEDGSAGRAVPRKLIDWTNVRAAHQAEERWRAQVEPRSMAAAAGIQSKGLNVDLAVSRDGLYRVTYEELVAAGFGIPRTKAATLAVTNRGVGVPIRVVAPSGFFAAGSFIEFYGQALDTLYTGTNIYRLTTGKDAGLRAQEDPTAPNPAIAAASSYLATERVERERQYGFSSPNGDPWYDTLFQAFAGGASGNFTLNADHVAAGAAPSLRVDIWGMTDWSTAHDHHARILWNGSEVGDEVFDGSAPRTVVAKLAPGAVLEGANTLTVAVPNDLGVDYDFLALDSFAVSYPRAFVARENRLSFTAQAARFEVGGFTDANIVAYRTTGQGNLVFVAGLEVHPEKGGGGFAASFPGNGSAATYHVATASSLLRPSLAATRAPGTILTGRADYLVIAHPDFVSGLGALVAARAAEGFAVRVVDVRDVYSSFSHGILDAAAISAYIRHAAQHMGTEYVLLVGGDSYDYRNFLGLGAISFLPSPYRETSQYVTFAPTDSAYADIDNDGVQDLAIGRWPVRTTAEVDTLVAQTLAYENKSYGGTAVFAADEADPSTGISFTVMSDRILATMPAGWVSDKAYLDLVGVAGAKNVLIDTINEGVALTSFVGHSGPTVWTFQGLFNNNDALQLTNAGEPTVVSQTGCWNTYYVSPLYDSVSQTLLLSGDRGASAVLGATGLTMVASDVAFGDQLGPRLAAPGMTIGQAVLDAKRALAAQHPEMVDVLLGWSILGDPALRVNP